MNIGQSAPRYEELAHIYAESKLLQMYLSEYFIVVVHLCHYVLQCSQQTSIGQFISSLSESKLNSFQSKLSHRGQFIRDEIVAITMSLIKDESSKSDKFRNRYLGDSKNAKHRRKMKLRAKLMERCTKYDHEPSWKQLRKAGTARFFTNTPGYQEWKSSASPKTLLWAGKIGSGKSVLLASIVDDLNLDQKFSHTLVTYFFCQWDISESLRARTILGSLARQVLSAYYVKKDEGFSWEDLSYDSDQPALDNLALMIKQAIPKGHRVVFVLDGIDECEETESLELFKQLASLQSTIELDVCASVSTNHKNASLYGPGFQELLGIRTLEIPEQNPDISSFVNDALSQRIMAKELVLRDEALILEIQQALLDGAQGMMLWVALQIEAICMEKTDSDIRKTLADLPKTLSEAFERELYRCSIRNSTKYRDRIISILLGAARPLTLDEFGEATSVEPENTTWDATKHINDMRSLLNCCGKLVSVDEESSAVRIVHHSVRQHFITNHVASNGAAMSEFEVQKILASIVITYLNYDVFERQLTIRVAEMSAKNVTTNVLARAMKSPAAADFTLKLLQQKDTPDFDIIKALTKLKTESAQAKQEAFAFKGYAEEFYMKHAWTLIAYSNSSTVPLFFSIIRRLATPIWSFIEDTKNKINADDGDPQINVPWASLRGRATLIALLHARQYDNILWLLKDSNGSTCLEWATEQSSSELLLHLVHLRAKKDLQADAGVASAFQTMLQKRRFDIAVSFLEIFSISDVAFDAVLVSLILQNDPTAVEWLLKHRTGAAVYINPFKSQHLRSLCTSYKMSTYQNRKYPALFFAIDTESAVMVHLLLKYNLLWQERHLQWDPSQIGRIYQFLSANGFTGLIEQLNTLRRIAQSKLFKTQFTVRALFPYGANPLNPREISYLENELLGITEIGDKWWTARNMKGEEGVVSLDNLFLLDELHPQAETEPTEPSEGDHEASTNVSTAKEQFPHTAKAMCSYKANPDNAHEISFSKGEILKFWGIQGRWWMAKNANGDIGLVPSNLLSIEESTSETVQASTSPSGVGRVGATLEEHTITDTTEYRYKARAIHTFIANPDNETEISVIRDEILYVSDINGRWWHARKGNGGKGVIPSKYLELMDRPAWLKHARNDLPKVDDCIEPSSEDKPVTKVAKYARAISDYEANSDHANEINLTKNELLDVLDVNEEWLQVRKADGETGTAPAKHIKTFDPIT